MTNKTGTHLCNFNVVPGYREVKRRIYMNTLKEKYNFECVVCFGGGENFCCVLKRELL